MSNIIPLNKQLSNSNNLSHEDFLRVMAQAEGGSNQRPRPKSLRLNGVTGQYEFRRWNPVAKATDRQEIGKSWTGVILMTKYFAKWKHDPKRTDKAVRTREFLSFRDEQIELLEIDYTKNEHNSRSLGFFQDYQSFKREHVNVDKVTGKETAPYDLWASLYVLRLEDMQVINMQLKGKSRSNLFDYYKAYKHEQPNAVALAHVVTTFEAEPFLLPGTSENAGDERFSSSFHATALVGSDVMDTVKSSVQGLVEWMMSFNDLGDEAQTIKVTADIEQPAKKVDPNEIDPASIPF